MQKVMSLGVNGLASTIGSPMLSKVWVDMRDGRGDFVFGRFNAEEFNQFANDAIWLSSQLGKLDLEDRNIWMRFDESITVFQKAPLQTLARFIVGSEPLPGVLAGAILQTADGGFDVAVYGDDS